jgi:hypothetical protein
MNRRRFLVTSLVGVCAPGQRPDADPDVASESVDLVVFLVRITIVQRFIE